MDSIERETVLVELQDAWREIAYAMRCWHHWVLKGRYRIDKAACSPRQPINAACAASMGVEPRLAKRMLMS